MTAPDRFRYEYRRETDYGSAAALLVSAQLWRDVGGFDERFLPMFYEDVDLCFQARERGLRVVYEPTAVVVHVEGATTGNDTSTGHKRFQEENRPKLVAKWRERLETEHQRPAAANLPLAADRHRGPHVLVVDHRIPMWDRDAGSLRIVKIMEALIALGARITFMPENFAPIEPYTRKLQNMGVEVLYGELDPRAELRGARSAAEHGDSLPAASDEPLAGHDPRAGSRARRSSTTRSTCTGCAKPAGATLATLGGNAPAPPTAGAARGHACRRRRARCASSNWR